MPFTMLALCSSVGLGGCVWPYQSVVMNIVLSYIYRYTTILGPLCTVLGVFCHMTVYECVFLCLWLVAQLYMTYVYKLSFFSYCLHLCGMK